MKKPATKSRKVRSRRRFHRMYREQRIHVTTEYSLSKETQVFLGKLVDGVVRAITKAR